ncbi:MAG: glycine cleavage system aminomethyltransferase GcvT [Thermoplasmata archaeon]|nr:glycine cleavage system aminomethyltransferase GcvT [Thermoplasmata archaeon]
MRKTPLHAEHVSAGARMAEFAGWDMPIMYTSVIEEHLTVRQRCGMFDVSHMGDVIIRGDGAAELVAKLMTNDVADAPLGRCVYSHMLDDDGHIIDDTIATPLAVEEFLMVPNAATTKRVVEWIRSRSDGQDVLDLSNEIATIAVQGPSAGSVIADLTAAKTEDIRPFWGAFVALDNVAWSGLPSSWLFKGREFLGDGKGVHVYLSRTGYTGEDGFEIACDNAAAVAVWRALMAHGGRRGLKPTGLGARDTLRLEKGLLLSGTDFDGAQTSLQTGPPWVVKFGHEFTGKKALEQQKLAGGYSRLVGISMLGRGIPRHGYEIQSGSAAVGMVTSGTMSPVLKRGIALGYVPQDCSEPGTEVRIKVRNDLVNAEVVKPPFVKRERK